MNFLLTCAAAIMINNTSLPWNSHDFLVLKRAENHCSEAQRCLKRFHKRGFQDYFAWCGK
jgi:hypothetical protein